MSEHITDLEKAISENKFEVYRSNHFEIAVSDENGNSYVWVSERGKLKKRQVELGKTDEETFTTKIKSGLSEDDYIAWADDTYKEGMKTTTEYQTETDGDANAS